MPLRVRVWGHFPTLPFLAVVGSRRPTQTAVSSVPWIVDAAVSSGWALLSGGARGVDGEVHRECLRRGGVTAVVLGSGLERPYHPEHADLFRRVVAQGGCVLSEYEADAPPRPWRFPQRNRLISAFSNAVMVVQAAERSGRAGHGPDRYRCSRKGRVGGARISGLTGVGRVQSPASRRGVAGGGTRRSRGRLGFAPAVS